MQKYLFDKKFVKTVLVVAIPLMLQQLISVSVNLVDNLMVGFLGDASLSAVATANRYYFVVNVGIMGLSSAGSVFVAQFLGANDKEKMQKSFHSILLLSVFATFIFSAIAFFFPREILSFFVQDEVVITEGIRYLHLAVYTYLPSSIAYSVYSCMRAVGDMHTPLHCSVISVLVNALLNYVFIFGVFGLPTLGVYGAALATLIARIIEVILLAIVLHYRSYPFTPSLKEMFTFPKEMMERIIIKALPLMTNEVLWSSGMAFLFKFYGSRGSVIISGLSISGTISDLFFTLFGGMAAATTVLVSTPLGADNKEEAKKNAYRLLSFSSVLAAGFGVLLFFSRFTIPYLYAMNSAQARQVASNILFIQSFMFWIYMFTAQCYFILRSGGDMKHTLMMDSGFMWLVNIPIVAAVTYGTDIPYYGVYFVSQCTDIIKLFFAHHLISKEKWVVNLTKESV